MLVREQQGLRFDIFRSYTSANDTAGAIKALRKYGPEEPQLYPAALAYFTSSPRALQEAGDELDTVLRKIDEDGLMAPLQVIQTLSSNAVATMGLVKEYLRESVERERREISKVYFGTDLSCFWLLILPRRTVVLSIVIALKPNLSAKRSMSLVGNQLFSRQEDAPLVEVVSTSPPCTFCANIPSINGASIKWMIRWNAQHAARTTLPFEPFEKRKQRQLIDTICFRMLFSVVEISLGQSANSLVEV